MNTWLKLKRVFVLVSLSTFISFQFSYALAQDSAYSYDAAYPVAKPLDTYDLTQPEGSSSIWSPGKTLTLGTGSDDLVPTDDVNLARAQVNTYPNNAEAAFILAVALTKTPYVEEALTEVKRAKQLAKATGDPNYFDKMIDTYEQMLTYTADDNRIRYGLAWAYYMKAYLTAEASRRTNNALKTPAQMIQEKNSRQASTIIGALGLAAQLFNGGGISPQVLPPTKSILPQIPSAIEITTLQAMPTVKKYYELCLNKMSQLLAQNPNDVWARVYAARVQAEYSGNLNAAMNTWLDCAKKFPNNPAPYFFLADGYMRQGQIPQALAHASKAVQIRAQSGASNSSLSLNAAKHFLPKIF
jgi:tetratricopeptide (TPR) repeat protein